MTNEEIDIRLKAVADFLPSHAELKKRIGQEGIQTELELLNMSAITIFIMLGEIAKRLPESGGLKK